MTRTRILFSIPNFVTAGSGLVILNILRNLDLSTFEPLVCVLQRGGSDTEVESLGVPLFSARFVVDPRPRTTLICRAWQAAKFFRPLNIDIWHSWHYLDDYSEPVVAYLSGAKNWIYTKKNLSWGSNAWLLRSILAKRIAVINSRMETDFFSSILFRGKVRFAPLGIDTTKFRRNFKKKGSLRSNLSIPDENYLIGCVASLVPAKDHQTLIRSIALTKSRPHLILIGGGKENYINSLRNYARGLGIGDRVHLLGYVHNNELPSVLSELDVFVLSSKHEGLGVSLLEAMACESACIATRCGGPENVIADGADGFLVTIGNSSEIAQRIDYLLLNPIIRARLGKAARKKVLEKYSIESQSNGYDRLYRELIV
jgi:glycosyltransferase involved in cell wall biosynthesis